MKNLVLEQEKIYDDNYQQFQEKVLQHLEQIDSNHKDNEGDDDEDHDDQEDEDPDFEHDDDEEEEEEEED